MRISDWSSDVCSSDLGNDRRKHRAAAIGKRPRIALDTVSLTRRRGRQRDAERPALRHHPQQGRLEIIILREARDIGEPPRLAPSEPRQSGAGLARTEMAKCARPLADQHSHKVSKRMAWETVGQRVWNTG